MEVDPEKGLISRIHDKIGKIDLIAEPRLADNFRLLVPLPDLEANYILGREQRLTSLDKIPNGLILSWKGPLTNLRGNLDLSVFLKIILAGQAIEFMLDVQNRTQYQIAEVWYPILGGMAGIGDRMDTREMIPYMGKSAGTNLFKDFIKMYVYGQLGIPIPELFWSYPMRDVYQNLPMDMPWVDIYNRKLNRGMYFGCHDTVCRYKTLRFELHPGIGSRQFDGNWPRTEERDERFPVGLKLHWANFPYTAPGETFAGSPVVVQFHEGDWHDAARIYREWFKSHFTILSPLKSWMRQEMAFMWTMFLLPEGTVLWKFKDIPRWAKSALDHNVKSVMIAGWNVGGHDGSYPYYEPDPRLGTWDDLAAGISECHRMGIRVSFFVNVQPIAMNTDWYRKELHQYVSRNKWGLDYDPMGWGMGTLGARLGYTRPNLINASPGIPQFREIIVRQMEKLAQIGADGLHFDKLWANFGLDFNSKSEMSPDQTTSEGQLRVLEEVLKACKALNPEFSLSTESAWDRTLPYANVAWAWHDNAKDHVPALKFTFPEWLPNIPVVQPYDFTAVNNAVRYGYQIMVGPGNFTASMDWEPMKPLFRYIKEVLRMLDELRSTIYLGQFLDTLQVCFEGPEDTRYTVFCDPKTGKRACVAINLGDSSREVSVMAFQGNNRGAIRIFRPFEKTKAAKLPVRVTIPAQRLLIVAEE